MCVNWTSTYASLMLKVKRRHVLFIIKILHLKDYFLPTENLNLKNPSNFHAVLFCIGVTKNHFNAVLNCHFRFSLLKNPKFMA